VWSLVLYHNEMRLQLDFDLTCDHGLDFYHAMLCVLCTHNAVRLSGWLSHFVSHVKVGEHVSPLCSHFTLIDFFYSKHLFLVG